MASRTAPDCSAPSDALRRRSPELLREELARHMASDEREVQIDIRDVMVGWAVFVDCARRLGIDPVALFDTASTGRSQTLRSAAAAFAGRSDVTLEAFGWQLDDRPEGPCYRPEPAPSRHQLRRHSSTTS